MDDPASSLMRDLENEYCPPLDPALFAALANDYDISDENSLQQLRDTLDTLKLSAAEQEDAPFDPSGTSGTNNVGGDADEIVSGQSESHRTLQSLESSITSLESDISSLNLDQNGSERNPQNGTRQPAPRQQALGGVFGGLCLEDKTAYLTDMFPSIDRFTIVHALRKCNENVDRSMDVLLNFAFFEEQQDSKVHVPKGIDGFDGSSGATTSTTGPGRRKRRNRRNRNRPLLSSESASASPSLSSAESGPEIENKWANGTKDVEFICSRTYLSHRSASSSYHLNSASLPATVHFLAAREAENHAKNMMDDPVTISQISELQQEYTSVSPEKLAGLLRLARNSISAANELAHVMVTVPPPTSLSDIVRINPPSVDLEEKTQNQNQNQNQRKTPARAASSSSPFTPIDYTTSRSAATSHIIAGQSAFAKANAAYRRGRSHHLMGAAAGYYSAIGREHIEKAKRSASAAADALVDSQSSSTMLDLHGVTVQDAVRIASDKVSEWWESLGDTKYAPGGWNPAREGYRIVTGLGRHSRDGTSRLGPAVARRLARDGWRVEVGEGVLTVTGMARRR